MNSATVIPAKAGIHEHAAWVICRERVALFVINVFMDSRLRGNDRLGGQDGAL